MGRTTTVTFEGRRHEIPDMWLAGRRLMGDTLLEAIAMWDFLARIEDEDWAPDFHRAEVTA